MLYRTQTFTEIIGVGSEKDTFRVKYVTSNRHRVHTESFEVSDRTCLTERLVCVASKGCNPLQMQTGLYLLRHTVGKREESSAESFWCFFFF